jgi:hypothetical protein
MKGSPQTNPQDLWIRICLLENKNVSICFMSLGYDVWSSLVNDYKYLGSTPMHTTKIRLSNNNSRDRNVILCGLTKSIYTKVMHYASTKEMWDKLKNIYEGDDKVKREKLQIYRGQFETLKMNEEENIVAIFFV